MCVVGSSIEPTIPVLIVEDSRPMQVALRNLLGTLSRLEVVSTAVSEMQATAWILENPRSWQLAIVDLLLEEGAGFNVVRRLRGAKPEGHVVVFSEFATAPLRQKCLELGADAVFQKSDLPEFVQHLEQHFERGTA